MKVIKLGSNVEISAVVRIAPIYWHNLALSARNETTNFVHNIALNWFIRKDRIVFTFDIPTEFEVTNKYEITLYNETTSELIYRGKLIVVKQNTDIQNYTPSKQKTQNRYKIKA